MAKIAISIQTETAEIPHTYDCGIGLEQNINIICSAVSKLVGIPAIYALSLPDGTILKEETATQDTLTKNPKLTLVVHPHKLKENASLKDVLQKIRDLDSDNQTTLKRAVFELVESLKNNDYATLFIKQNGTARLIDTVEKLKIGNTLAYTLNALVTLMNSNNKFPAVRSNLMKKVFEIVKDGNINVARPAMQFLALLLGSKIHDMSAILFLVSRKWQMNWPQAISFLTSSDIGIQVATLNFLNSFLRAMREEVFASTSNNSKTTLRKQLKSIDLATDGPSSTANLSPEEDIAEFERYIFESLDVVQIVQKQAEIDHNAFLKEEIVKFQCLYVSYLIQHKSVTFDEKDATHLALIQRLWKAVNSDQDFPGLNSAKWIDLGFQGKNPISDLRAAGLLGLEHLVYFAETYPNNFKKILAEQNTLPVERQYPVATAGINITNLMGNVFTTADKVYPMIFEPNGLLNMYCIIFEKLDVEWYKQNATYMQFNTLFETIKTRLASILAYGKISVELFKKLMLEVDSNRIKIVVPTAVRDSVGANLAKSFPKLNMSSEGPKLSMSFEGPKSADPAPQLQVRSLHQDSASPRRSTAEPSHRRTPSNQNIELRRNSNESMGRDSRSSSNETIESPRSLQVMSTTVSPRPLPTVPSPPKVTPVAPAKLPPPPPPLVLRANSKGNMMESTAPPLPPPRSASPSPGHSPQISPRLTMPPQYPPPLPPNVGHTMPPPNNMPPPVIQRAKK